MKKRLLGFLALVMLFASGIAQGQVLDGASITLDNVTPLYGNDTLEVGQQITFSIRFTNNSALTIGGSSNGFRIYSPTGATWDTTIGALGAGITAAVYDGGRFLNSFSADGAGADTVGVGGFVLSSGTGFNPGFNAEGASITIGPIPAEFHQGQICIDSTFYRPTNEWEWADVDGAAWDPVWDGPHCFTIFDPNATPGANLVVTPASLNFATTEGVNPANQNISVTSDGAPLDYSVTDNAPWLMVLPASGTTPGNLTASVDVTGLVAGNYAATVVINSTTALNAPESVTVALTVTPAPVSNLVADPTSLTFTAEENGANPANQLLDITSDNQPLSFTISDNGSWLTVTPESGTTPQSLTVSANVAGLAPGVYNADITVTSAGADNSPLVVPVTFTVTAAPVSNLVLNPTLLTFNATAGGANPVDQSVVVSSDNLPLNFTVATDQTWLSVNPTSGSTMDTLIVSVDITGVVAGDYMGHVIVSSDGADNSPETTMVVLSVQPGVTPVIVDATPDFFCVEPIGADTVTLTVIGQNTQFTDGVDAITLFTGSGKDFVELNGFNIIVINDTLLTVDFFVIGASPDGVTYTLTVSGTGFGDDLPGATTIAGRATLTANPSVLNFETTIGEPLPAGQAVNITSNATETSFMVVGADIWTILSATAGTTPDQITVSVDPEGMAAGNYVDTLFVSGSCATVDTVIVNLTINPAGAPDLVVAPLVLNFVATEGGANPASQALAITASDGSSIDYSLAESVDWVSLSANAGNTPANVDVGIDITGVAAGSYQTTITATSETAENDPIVVTVNLTVNPDLGTNELVVGTAPAVPGATIVVPVNFTNGCNLASATVALEWASEFLTLDEVSFAGSRVAGLTTLSAAIDNDNNNVIITVLAANETEWVAPGTGLLASLSFTVSPFATPGSYDITIGADDDLVPHDNPLFTLDCGTGPVAVEPTATGGAVVVGEQPNFTCGYVVDPDGEPIAGATVELWADFPYGSAALTTTTDPEGYYSFSDFTINPFDIYVYANGYYPNKAENLNFGCFGTEIVLQPLEGITPTYEWVNFYCGNNTYMEAPLPIGSVIEARDPQGVLCGRFMVTEPGTYGFMPVYRDDEFTPAIDEGCLPGDNVTFYVNGIMATATGSTIWTANGDSYEVCLDAGDMVTKTCALEAGWNLVSWNIDTESDDLETVLAPLAGNLQLVMGFEQGGLTYDPNLPDFSTLWTVDHLSGYWIRVSEATTLEITGMSVPENTPIAVTPGWNLVSYLPETGSFVEDALASLAGNVLVSLGWDNEYLVYQPGQGDFNTLDELLPCNGYWVKVTSADELIYGSGDMLAGIADAGSAKSEIAASRSLANKDGVVPTKSWLNTYGANVTLNGQPIASGSRIEAYSQSGVLVGAFTTQRSGAFGFMPVYGDDNNTREIDGIVTGESFTLAVNGVETNESFTWTGSGDKVEISTLTAKGSVTTVPGSYILNQNHPNPFNPSTNISFAVPTAGKVKIEVFDLLGRKVAEPLNQVVEAGNHTIVWNGRTLEGAPAASGVYFYRLSAGSFTETRKMTLMK